MFKFALMAAIVGAGLFLGLHETPNGSLELINSAQAQLAPLPGVFALLGIGGLAMVFGLKRKP